MKRPALRLVLQTVRMRAGAFSTAMVVTLLTVFGLEMPTVAEAAAPATITGQLMNGTSGRSVPNAEISLLEMGTGEASVVARGRTDRAGRFRFTGLDHSGERTLLVTTTYKDVPYFSAPVRLTVLAPAASAEISVFEPTRDPTVVVVAFRIVMVQQVLPGRLLVRDVIGLRSREPRTFVGQEAGVTRLSAPPGATNIQVARGLAPLTVGASAVVDALPVTPRVREAVLKYEVGYRLRRAAIRWPVEYPTASFDLILPDGIQVSEVNLTAQAPRQVQGQRLLRFTAEDLPPGRDVTVVLTGLPLNARPYLLALAGVVLAAALLGALALPLLRKRHGPQFAPERLRETVDQLDPETRTGEADGVDERVSQSSVRDRGSGRL